MSVDLDVDFIYGPARDALELALVGEFELQERCRANWAMLPQHTWIEMRRIILRWERWRSLMERIDYERGEYLHGPANDNQTSGIAPGEFARASAIAEALAGATDPDQARDSKS